MNTYEQLLYLLRIPFLLLCAIVVAVIFNLAAPTTDQASIPGLDGGVDVLRADHYAALVANHDELYLEPGVIDFAAFTQETADKKLVFEEPHPFLFAVYAELQLPKDRFPATEKIIYNTDAWGVLEITQSLGTVNTHTKDLPVTVQHADGTRETMILHLTTYYAS